MGQDLKIQSFDTYCALGPTLAASMIYMCIFQLNNKKHAERRTLFENGEMAVTLPTAALSGRGFGSLRCETEAQRGNFVTLEISKT